MILYSKNLLMEQKDEINTDKILPVEWGTLKSFGVSAVPADDVRGSYAKKCFTFITDKGGFSVVNSMNTQIPTIDEILSANFVEKVYTNEYNGAIFWTDNKWTPAVSVDMPDRIAYKIDDIVKRNIRHTTLRLWGWRDGNLSTKIDGYSYNIAQDNTLSIFYNNSLVLKLK